ncbi:hypothetical protein HT031_006746 [Scenedesmus sp. PABB004]|nr:hypothetical protein HT031_006746 [Scenedesmus sp. PABB004]
MRGLLLPARSCRGAAAAAPPCRSRRRARTAASSGSGNSGAASSASSSASNAAANSAANKNASSSSGAPITDWEARRRRRVVDDLFDASRRLGPAFTREAIAEGVTTLEALLPGLQVDVEALKAADWARLALDVGGAATKLVLLKSCYPGADLSRVIQRQPGLLLLDASTLEENSKQVKSLLSTAKDADALLTALPSLMEPRTLISVLVTVRKWYFNKRDPVEVLEADPELILRAQACGVPLDPVYMDETGNWSAPGFDYLNKRAPWQEYLDKKHKKRDYLPETPLTPVGAADADAAAAAAPAGSDAAGGGDAPAGGDAAGAGDAAAASPPGGGAAAGGGGAQAGAEP